jgi:hypothetical protein
MPGQHQTGQFTFQAYGGAGGGYYFQTQSMACDWTIAITPL